MQCRLKVKKSVGGCVGLVGGVKGWFEGVVEGEGERKEERESERIMMTITAILDETDPRSSPLRITETNDPRPNSTGVLSKEKTPRKCRQSIFSTSNSLRRGLCALQQSSFCKI